jgi:predicted Zn-dependent protease with MMP-like domain
MVQAAFTVLPQKYTYLCDAVMIQVKDFPDQETLEKVHSKNKFGVLGTFHGRAIVGRNHRGCSFRHGA